MIKIRTESINNRADWFHAQAKVKGVSYDSFMSTRIGALMDVLRKLHARGILAY